jgi:sugar/nucleoside kinase (ribokinase family)
VVKLGEFGAKLFGPDGAFFRCGAWPLRDLADPTGAGDTFLGGLIGTLASEGAVSPSFDQLKKAVVNGSILASFTCENFSTKSLELAGNPEFSDRLDQFQQISAW